MEVITSGPMYIHACKLAKCRIAVITCEIKLFQKYFSIRRRPSEIILFHYAETCLKLFQSYFRGLLQLVNIFQHVRCQ